ncbi:MAG: ATP-binding protein [Patescibacteria group bacterium]
MKKRLLYYETENQLEHKNALVITGMRQVGKTTLLLQLFDSLGDKPKLFFDFDNPLDQKMFEDEQYNNIYSRLVVMAGAKDQRLYIFLDEIQNFPMVTKVMKYLIDHYKTKFVVTGSSSFYLKNLFPESLSGRKFLYVLPTLTFREYLYFTDLISLDQARNDNLEEHLVGTDLFIHKRYEVAYDQYLIYGGFPEVATTHDSQTKSLVLRNIFGSFFEKDIHLLSDHSDIRQLRDLILLLVPRVGSMIDVTKLANALSIDRPKLYSFLDFLQNTFMITLLPKFSHSIDRSVAGGRKVYFTDTGLLTAIGNVNDGQLFENAVCNQLSHYGGLSFYNRRNTAEIDFILNKEIAFEVKLTADSRDVQKVQKLATNLGIPKCYVLSKYYSDKDDITSAINI